MFFNFPQSSPQNVVTQLEVKCLKDFYLTGTNPILQMEKKKQDTARVHPVFQRHVT